MGRMQREIQKLESRIAEMKQDIDQRFKTYEQSIKHEHTKLNQLLSQHNTVLNNTRNEYNLVLAQKESKRMSIYEDRNLVKPINYTVVGKSDSNCTLVIDDNNNDDTFDDDKQEMKREKSFESLRVERMIAQDVRRNVFLRELRIINDIKD